MGDPDAEENGKKQALEPPRQARSFFFGGSFSKEIGLVLLASAAYAAVQWGGESMDRLAKWIDGEEYRPVAATAIETPATLGYEPPADVADGVVLAKAGATDGSVIQVADFRLNTDAAWSVGPMAGPMRPHPYFERLLNPTLGYRGPNSSLIEGVPESYIIQLPDDAGQIVLLRKTAIINRQLTAGEIMSAIEKYGADGVSIISLPENTSGENRIESIVGDSKVPFIINGNVEAEAISEDDLFDEYFITQISTMMILKNTHGSIDIRRLRRQTVDGYDLGEVDYIIGSGTLRITAVFYWRQRESAQWGEFGLFLALRREPVDRKHRRVFETVATLRLMDGEREVWRGLDYEAPADAGTGTFVHVEVSGARLRAFGLNVRQVEREVRAQLPISEKELEDVVIRADGDTLVYLRDIASLNSYALAGDGVLYTPDSIVLTVTP